MGDSMIKVNDSFEFNHIDCGYFSVDGEWIYPRREGNCFEIIYAVSGNIFLREDDKEYLLKSGDLIVLHPGKKWEGTQGSFGRTSFYWAQFDTDAEDLIPENYFCSFENNELTSQFDGLLHSAHTPEEPPFIADSKLLIILNEIKKNALDSAQKPPQFIRDVAEWIRINSDKRLTVELVSKLFGYNSDYLSGVFNDFYGLGLKEYINEQKILRIKDLLLNTNYSVKYLADILGYANENQFINYFKYHTGLSPTKFKTKYFNSNFS